MIADRRAAHDQGRQAHHPRGPQARRRHRHGAVPPPHPRLLRERGLRRGPHGLHGKAQARVPGQVMRATSGKKDKRPPTGLSKGLTSYGDAGFSLFLRKAFIKGAGYTDDALARPVIGIADTGSGFNPCHGNAPQLIEAVKRGVMLAGGLPVEFPTISHPRELRAPDQHVPAQPHVDGHRGDDPRAADGRGRAHRRLRQDGARAADGRGLRGRARDPARHGLDAHRLARRRARRRLHRLPPLLGPLPRRGDRRRRDRARERPARRERRHLLGDGHGEHDGLRRRGAGHDAARQRVAAGRHRRPHARRRAHRRHAPWRSRRAGSRPTASSPRSRSRTRCACCSPSAARPTASSTSRRSPGGSASRSTSRASTRSAARRRCSSI